LVLLNLAQREFRLHSVEDEVGGGVLRVGKLSRLVTAHQERSPDTKQCNDGNKLDVWCLHQWCLTIVSALIDWAVGPRKLKTSTSIQ
jgi:hypothetical protein